MKHKYSTYALLAIFLLFASSAVLGDLVSEEVDQLCNINDSILFKPASTGKWGCGNLTDVNINVTVNNITHIMNNFSLFSNQTLTLQDNNISDVALWINDSNTARYDGDINVTGDINNNGTIKSLNTEGTSSRDNFVSEINLNEAGNSRDYNAFKILFNYILASGVDSIGAERKGLMIDFDFDSTGAAVVLSDIAPFEIDMDYVGALPITGIKAMKVDVLFNDSSGDEWIDVVITNLRTGGAEDNKGMKVRVEGNSSGNYIGLRTEGVNKGSGSAIGYQGFAQQTGTGDLIAMDAAAFGAPTNNVVIGLRSLELLGGVKPSLDRIFSFMGFKGHILNSVGSLWMSRDPISNLTTNPSDHISTITDGGSGYFAGKLEVDNISYFDNHINQTAGNATINMIYGEMFNHTDTGFVVTISDSVTYFNVTNLVVGELNGFTFDASTNSLTPQISGLYKLNWALAFGDGANTEFQIAPLLNNEEQAKCETHRATGTSGDVGSTSGTCFLRLVTTDIVQLGMKNIDNTNNPTIFTVNLNLVRIGN